MSANLPLTSIYPPYHGGNLPNLGCIAAIDWHLYFIKYMPFKLGYNIKALFSKKWNTGLFLKINCLKI